MTDAHETAPRYGADTVRMRCVSRKSKTALILGACVLAAAAVVVFTAVATAVLYVARLYGNMYENPGFTESGLDYSVPGFDDISYDVITEEEYNSMEFSGSGSSDGVPDESTEPDELPDESTEPDESFQYDEGGDVTDDDTHPSPGPGHTDSDISEGLSADESSQGQSYGESEHVYSEPQFADKIKLVEPKSSHVVNILLIGRDSLDPANVAGRSDAMIVVSYDSKNDSVRLLSFDRDLLVPIEGHGWSKLNNSYYWGGAGLLINTLNSVFGLDIRYYITIDLRGIIDVVDRIGGLDIYLSQDEVDTYLVHGWGTAYPELCEGYNHLDGRHVMYHVQNRSDSVAKRAERQRQVVAAIMEKLSGGSLRDMLGLLDYCSMKVKTNLPLSKLVSYASAAASGVELGGSGAVPFTGEWEYVRYGDVAAKKCDFDTTARLIDEYLYG